MIQSHATRSSLLGVRKSVGVHPDSRYSATRFLSGTNGIRLPTAEPGAVRRTLSQKLKDVKRGSLRGVSLDPVSGRTIAVYKPAIGDVPITNRAYDAKMRLDSVESNMRRAQGTRPPKTDNLHLAPKLWTGETVVEKNAYALQARKDAQLRLPLRQVLGNDSVRFNKQSMDSSVLDKWRRNTVPRVITHGTVQQRHREENAATQFREGAMGVGALPLDLPDDSQFGVSRVKLTAAARRPGELERSATNIAEGFTGQYSRRDDMAEGRGLSKHDSLRALMVSGVVEGGTEPAPTTARSNLAAKDDVVHAAARAGVDRIGGRSTVPRGPRLGAADSLVVSRDATSIDTAQRAPTVQGSAKWSALDDLVQSGNAAFVDAPNAVHAVQQGARMSAPDALRQTSAAEVLGVRAASVVHRGQPMAAADALTASRATGVGDSVKHGVTVQRSGAVAAHDDLVQRRAAEQLGEEGGVSARVQRSSAVAMHDDLVQRRAAEQLGEEGGVSARMQRSSAVAMHDDLVQRRAGYNVDGGHRPAVVQGSGAVGLLDTLGMTRPGDSLPGGTQQSRFARTKALADKDLHLAKTESGLPPNFTGRRDADVVTVGVDPRDTGRLQRDPLTRASTPCRMRMLLQQERASRHQ